MGTGGLTTDSIGEHYLRLPGDAADIIRTVLAGPLTEGLETVTKADAETVELVYFNDAEYKPAGQDWKHGRWNRTDGTRLARAIPHKVQDTVQSYFGPAWVVAWKPDERESTGRSIQRLLVRRVRHVDFKYHDESYASARKVLEGIDIDADTYGELDLYPQPPNSLRNYRKTGDDDSPPEVWPLDVYVYETDTGTIHLAQGRTLRTAAVTDDVKCLCGTAIPAERIRDGDVHHLADYVHERAADLPDYDEPPFHRKEASGPHPLRLFAHHLCTSCAKDYCDVERNWDDNIRSYYPAWADYNRLVDWDDGRADEVEVPI